MYKQLVSFLKFSICIYRLGIIKLKLFLFRLQFAFFAIVAVASAGIIAPVIAPIAKIGIGGLSYTQRLNGYGPILGVGHVGVIPAVGIGHIGHVGIGHVGVIG